ncbi:MAG: transglycosylase domain-containing protein [Defluviicoccus sp.]|nr:transglycosylase domain-containing protein [Defluviicoccus sp.]MDG4593194.1 transglycosylase domain-containing protein [Defluviicoccus sp.]
MNRGRASHSLAIGLVLCGVFICTSIPVGATDVLGTSFTNARDLFWVNMEPGLRVLDCSGKLIGTVGAQYGAPISTEKVSKHFINALIAKEDKRFYEHSGIDFSTFFGIGYDLVMRQRSRGGSTLTMQVIKMVLLTRQERDDKLRRKIIELFNATTVEKYISKENVLFLYINRAYFGKNVYGIRAASLFYFGKEPRRLTLKESAALVGLLPAPAKYNPIDHPDKSEEQARLVLNLMLEQGKISAQMLRNATKQKLSLSSVAQTPPQTKFFINHVASIVEDFKENYTGKTNIRGGTLTIKSTLDPVAQAVAEKSVVRHLSTTNIGGGPDQGALLAIRRDGSVLAMVGGRDFRENEFNQATKSQRQAGSTFKIFVYLDAFERGLTPDSEILIGDVSREYGHHVRNADGIYPQRIVLREGFINSVNTAAVRLAIGRVSNIVDIAEKMGMAPTFRRTSADRYGNLRPNLGVALGTEGVRLIDLVGAYNVIPNEGRYLRPHVIEQIRDTKGSIVYKKSLNPKPVIRQSFVTYMKDLLVGAMMRGTGRAASLGRYAGGKTGTTQEYRDAWFIGFDERLTTGVWLGNRDNSPMQGITGGNLPAKIWRNFMLECAKRRCANLP